MAIKTGSYPIEAKLIDMSADPTVYDGVEVGEIISTRAIGFKRDVETYDKQTSGTIFDDAAILGFNAILELVVTGVSASAMKLMFSKLNNPNAGATLEEIFSFGVPADYVWGHKVKKAGLTTPLILKADDFADRPSVYFPKALVIEMGPWQFEREGQLHDATVLTIVALMDADTGAPFHVGVESALPDIGGA